MDIDLQELTLDNIAIWPFPVKVVAVVSLALLLGALAYYFDISDQQTMLKQEQHREIDLRSKFESKQQQAVNLNAYKQQLETMQKVFGKMLHQLPSKTEIPGLLEDISRTGIASGLKFELFDPLEEVTHDFYVELPIKIVVVGTYAEFATFISRVASLNRIVTLHDFIITGDKMLEMKVTAKVYRYKGEV